MAIKRVENDAYEIKHLEVDAELGDRETMGFKPSLKLKRWLGECELDVRFEVEEGELEEETDAEGNITKIKWKVKTADFELELEYEPVEPRTVTTIVDGKEHKFLQNELGGLELGVVLTKKPLVNTLEFPIKSEGLKFYYQPPLTQKEIERGAFRPENVVGSYAVYHATRTNMHRSKEDAEKYKCGKAFHIYRPKLTDAEGTEAWATLNITDSELTITLPQDFLDKAVYPVSVDPTFGWTSAGETEWDGLEWAECLVASDLTYTASAGDTITKFSVYGAGLVTEEMAAYAIDESNVPGARLSVGVGVYLGSTPGWYHSATVSQAMTDGVRYGPAIGATNAPWVYYDSVTGAANEGDHTDLPDPWVAYGSVDYRWSIYCTYTAAAPPVMNPALKWIPHSGI